MSFCTWQMQSCIWFFKLVTMQIISFVRICVLYDEFTLVCRLVVCVNCNINFIQWSKFTGCSALHL